MRVRLPYVSGQFYESEKALLKAQVLDYLPQKRLKQRVKGLLVPHAGLMYSGPVAGETYASAHCTETVVLLGPNHTGEGKPFSVSGADFWRTPLGDVAVDPEFRKLLFQYCPELEEDDTAHLQEHSIEVQLPFLQILSKTVQIVPICVGTFELCETFGDHLAEAISASGRDIVVIATSDMTHYEPHERAKKKDCYAIEAILSLDAGELARRVKERRISMCGFFPALVLISYARKRGAAHAELVRYQTSGNISGDFSSVVGYAGILVPEAA